MEHYLSILFAIGATAFVTIIVILAIYVGWNLFQIMLDRD